MEESICIKKAFSLILVCVLLSLLVTNSFAAANDKFKEINKALNIEMIDQDLERNDIVSTITGSMKNIDDTANKLEWRRVPSRFSNYYKVYYLKENIRKYYSSNNFEKLISSNNAVWEVPVLSEAGEVISTIRASKFNGKWVTSEGHSMPLELIEFYSNPENIQTILTENNIKNPSMVKHIRIRELYTDFYYIKDGKDEYVVPFANEPERLKITNFKLYKLADFIDILSPIYIDPNNVDNEKVNENKKFGGLSDSHTDYSLYFIISIAIIGILLIALLLYKRKWLA
ncbi:hypothetical protein [Petroclostridium xylanilyticum]|uniref:hypothetical protein n=1 Tax=Petroclostridium xylanilyticum TaxID=1792311 RepID=UPI000B98B66A|nr:hypothetical protein [Petroclostridium xylanilyticum]